MATAPMPSNPSPSASYAQGTAAELNSSGNATANGAVTARRIRKREQDRRSQRLARERTKNRMTYLEGLVADLKEQNANKQLQALWEERDQLATERDMLAHSLRAIENALRSSRNEIPANSGLGPSPPNSQTEQLSRENGDGRCTNDGSPQVSQPVVPRHSASSPSHQTPPAESAAWSPAAPAVQPDVLCQTDLMGAIRGPRYASALTLQPDSNNLWPEVGSPAISGRGHGQDPIVPYPMSSCECTPAPGLSNRGINMWRFANETLSEPTEWSTYIRTREDALEDDTPIRAVIEGWDAAEKHAGGSLPQSWSKLRRIDETIFSSCAEIERLAILRSMHSLLRYHQEPTERCKKMPKWYLARPSQAMAHSYAIDFFTWPGLRERFVFHQHRYCTNRFWRSLCSDFRIIWPFEFRDCYSRNVVTGEYKLGPDFRDRIADIRAWTMSSDIFKIWPEFLADIPAYDSVPAPLSLNSPEEQAASTSSDWAIAKRTPDNVPNNSNTNSEEEQAVPEQGNERKNSPDMDSLIGPLSADDGFQFYNDFGDMLVS